MAVTGNLSQIFTFFFTAGFMYARYASQVPAREGKNLMKLLSFLWKNVRITQYNNPRKITGNPVYIGARPRSKNKEEHYGNNNCLNAGGVPGA